MSDRTTMNDKATMSDTEMKKVYSRTKTFREDMVAGFCPGCMHGTVFKLIGEVLEELGVVDRTACVFGVGCCGLAMEYITCCKPAGMPMRKMVSISALWKRTFRGCRCTMPWLCTSARTPSTAEVPQERMVAQATPATPIRK